MKRLIYSIIIPILLITYLLALTTPAHAAKRRTRRTTRSYSSSSGYVYVPYTRAKLNRLTNSVSVTFLNVDQTTESNYTLAYTANGVPQGAVGTVAYTGSSTEVRDLYFGTCSRGVCTPHYNITNASLTIITQLQSGGVYRKKYVIKI